MTVTYVVKQGDRFLDICQTAVEAARLAAPGREIIAVFGHRPVACVEEAHYPDHPDSPVDYTAWCSCGLGFTALDPATAWQRATAHMEHGEEVSGWVTL